MTATDLPRWDVSDVFPAIGSREYAAAREQLGAGLSRLTALYDEHDVRGGDDKTVDDATLAAFDAVVVATNELMDEVRLVGGYLSTFVSTDSRDATASGEQSELQAELAQLSRLRSRFDAWVGSLGADELAARSGVAADHAYPLQRSEERARHQMTEAEEGLLADLSLTGSTAWQRLWGVFTSQLVVDVPGQGERLSMSQVRNLAYHADAGSSLPHATQLMREERHARGPQHRHSAPRPRCCARAALRRSRSPSRRRPRRAELPRDGGACGHDQRAAPRPSQDAGHCRSSEREGELDRRRIRFRGHAPGGYAPVDLTGVHAWPVVIGRHVQTPPGSLLRRC